MKHEPVCNRTTDDPAASLPVTRAGVEEAVGSVSAVGGSPTPRSTEPFRVIESTARGNRFMVVDERGDAEVGNWFIASTWFRDHAEFIADCFAAKLEAHPPQEFPTYVKP